MSALKGAVLVGGVYTFFLGFGVAQEKVYKSGDPLGGDAFRYSFFLVMCMCIANALLSGGILIAQSNFIKRMKSLDKDVYFQIFLTSLTYVCSMLATNYALTHVSYPTQVLVKSIKMVPVTLGGFFFFGKKYPWYDYAAVVIISSALAIFNFAKGGSSTTHQTTLGIVLLMVSLFCDSMTGPRQDKLLSKYTLSPIEIMFITNICAIGTTGSIVAGVEGTSAVAFCFRFPSVIKHIISFCLCGAMGQLFIFFCLTSYGSLYLTLITTTRKFFTVMLSVIMFGHHINVAQWGCVAAIFGSLTVQSYYSKMDKQRKSTVAPVKGKLA